MSSSLHGLPNDIMSQIVELLWPSDLRELVVTCNRIHKQIQSPPFLVLIDKKKRRVKFARHVVTKVYTSAVTSSVSIFRILIGEPVSWFLDLGGFKHAGLMVSNLFITGDDVFESNQYDYLCISLTECYSFIKPSYSFHSFTNLNSTLPTEKFTFKQTLKHGDSLWIRRDEVLRLMSLWKTVPSAHLGNTSWFHKMQREITTMIVGGMLKWFETQ